MKHPVRYVVVFVVAILVAAPARAQQTIVHGYEFTTGVDSSLWYDMTVSTPWAIFSTSPYTLPFQFFFWDRDYQVLHLYRDCSVLFTNTYTTYSPHIFFPGRNGFMGIYGYSGTWSTYGVLQSGEFGSVGNRVLVIQIEGPAGSGGATNRCQIQLREEDYSITIVYGEMAMTGFTPVRIGLQFDSNHVAVVDPVSHTVSAEATGTGSSSWPGRYRYYRFVPGDSLCPIPKDLTSELVPGSDDEVLLMWNSCSVIDSFRVEYGPLGFAEGEGTSVMVHSPPLVLQGIHSTDSMEARIYAECTNGESEYDSTMFTTCPVPEIEWFDYAGLTTSDQLLLVWHPQPWHHGYRVEYGPPGFAEGAGTSVVVNDTSLVLPVTSSIEELEARVYGSCTYGESSYSSILFRNSCSHSSGNIIHYDNLYVDSVKCCVGTFDHPATISSAPNIVNMGSESINSRHTIHKDTSERDPRTNSLLRTVPEGFCSSVRLGNWRNGGQQESIFYTLTIDTTRFDLLILRYALVEEDPHHPLPQQPRFEFDILDPLGNSINPCYHGNFVSGDLSGWNQIANSNIVWHDWDAVGVDLTPLHGQTVTVSLSNYDCRPGGHFGYAYFTLESGTKRILAESCGDETVNTFRAPDGFSYRWFSAADSTTTLSTADTLYVAEAGDYGCHVTYQLSNQLCGFYLSTFAGGRFPVAAFGMELIDSCYAQIHFVNQSVIARDETHTQLTSFPCDEYLWVIDDSITSSAIHPTFGFGEGTHTVKLYAMLANGACVDSTSQTFTVALQHDTLHASICTNESYPFFGQMLTEAGVYEHLGDCHHTVLYLEVNPVHASEVYDTFLLGVRYQFGESYFYQPGVYLLSYTTTAGCDSTVTLYLSCIDRQDTTVCETSLPLEWQGVTFADARDDTLRLISREGTDSIVVLSLAVLQLPVLSLETSICCHEPGGHLLLLPDTLCYFFTSIPADVELPSGWTRGNQLAKPLLLSPSDTTTYFLTSDYCDTLRCPRYDSLLLVPVAAVEAHLSTSLPSLDENNLDFTAMDLTPQPHERQWFFNGTPPTASDSLVIYHASTSDDSVRVMLVVNTDICSDTAITTVPVRIQSLWFPNIFTPDEPTNNVFKGYGINVKDYDLKIFTRWGDCFFHTTDLNEGWDGTYHGIKSPVSAYVYLCHYTTLDGEPRTVCGTVTLVR